MIKLLFICTHNRCRSILAEAIANHLSEGRIDARSAGSQPVGEVHPLTLKYLEEQYIPTAGLQSQSWDEFENWNPDVAITVCDSAAGEPCPLWLGHASRVHWGLSDPSRVEGTTADVRQAFAGVISTLRIRLQEFLNCPLETMNNAELVAALQEIGEK